MFKKIIKAIKKFDGKEINHNRLEQARGQRSALEHGFSFSNNLR